MLVAAIVAYCVLRSLLLATIEAPEARYTIEVIPDALHPGGRGVRYSRNSRYSETA